MVVDEERGRCSCLKGERPCISRPARFRATLRATTWLTGSRARMSSRRDGGKRMGVRISGVSTHSLCDSVGFPCNRGLAGAARPVSTVPRLPRSQLTSGTYDAVYTYGASYLR